MSGIPQTNGISRTQLDSMTNYVAYKNASHSPRIGHLNLSENTIQPLSFKSGSPIPDLYAVIEAGAEEIVPVGDSVPLSHFELLAPISGRDILAVGKNYAEHAVEFNSSGFDSSDRVDQPTHPVIFTKRFTSIIASGEEIFPHPGFTESLDYEGEIGVIVGKSGFKIDLANAMDHVWGYTIINDMTARERQRDHKQFYIGKSPDTFCPMGPIAVPKEKLESTLRVRTMVNGNEKQNATTEQLIFSIPFLIKTLSEGQTLCPGDVIATGTPAGVGIGKKPPVFLKTGDVIEVSVTGLGTLKNTIANSSSKNYIVDRVNAMSHLPITNLSKSCGGIGLTTIHGKTLYYRKCGTTSGTPIVFIHGLGGTNEFFNPLISTIGMANSNPIHLFDLEGHGLSPTSALSILTIESFADDVKGIFEHAGISGAIVVAHSMGCLIALQFALYHSEMIKKLILLGPPPSPLPEAASKASHARAQLVRDNGMAAVVDAVVSAGTSEQTKAKNPTGLTAVRLSLLGQDPEGYAKACMALAGSITRLDIEQVSVPTLIITGSEDKVSPPELCDKMKAAMSNCDEPIILEGVGHWHLFEDALGVSEAVKTFIA